MTGGEERLVAQIKSQLRNAGVAGGENIVGIGDDAAVVTHANGDLSLHTTDALVAGVHFEPNAMMDSPYKVGWKAAVVNQSDIAAMGGTPEFALITLGLDGNGTTSKWCEKLYDGFIAALQRFGGVCIGGDTVRTQTKFISVTLTGYIKRESDGGGATKPLLRSAAQFGDEVGVTGTLGAAASWVHLHHMYSKERFFTPTPRLTEGRLLRALGVRCAMDVSDGLCGDLRLIGTASNVSAEIECAAVPVDTDLQRDLPHEALDLALNGGEDYELLFTCPPEIMATVLAHPKIEATRIGRIVECRANEPQVKLLDENGRIYTPRWAAWDHLRRLR